MSSTPTPTGADRLDALRWLAALLLLGLVPIGWVSGDGLSYARQFAAGAWRWNPNHLLFEPAGAAWHRLFLTLGSVRPVVDQLKLLSILSGAIAAALFRSGVAPRLAGRRWRANYATAWLVLGSGYAQLLVADEYHMIQMPLLVGFAAALLRTLDRPTFGRALAAGALAGGAVLCLLSNVLLDGMAAVVLAVHFLARRDRDAAVRAGGGILLGLLLVAGMVLAGAWRLTAPGRPLSSWLLSYSGVAAPPRSGLAYGVRWTSGGVAVASARAAYGAASALVDLAPAVADVRDRAAPGPAARIALAWLLAATALAGSAWSALRRRGEPAVRAALLLQAIWWPAVLGFGLCWNNSDDQFYFQLAVAFGALMACAPSRGRGARLLLLCGAAALAWNLCDVVQRFIRYPRAEWTAALMREIQGAGLVVTPGFDDASVLLALAGGGVDAERLSLTDLAVEMPAEPGLERLAAAARRTLARGRRVDLVDLYDTAPLQLPWKFLRQLGYRRRDVQRALARFGVDAVSRRAGPFFVRSIRPRPTR